MAHILDLGHYDLSVYAFRTESTTTMCGLYDWIERQLKGHSGVIRVNLHAELGGSTDFEEREKENNVN